MEAKPDNKTATTDNSSSSSRWPMSFKENLESAKKRGSEEKKQGSKIHAPVHATPYVPTAPTSSSQPPENKSVVPRESPAISTAVALVESVP
jgi:hypothetical protein